MLKSIVVVTPPQKFCIVCICIYMYVYVYVTSINMFSCDPLN